MHHPQHHPLPPAIESTHTSPKPSFFMSELLERHHPLIPSNEHFVILPNPLCESITFFLFPPRPFLLVSAVSPRCCFGNGPFRPVRQTHPLNRSIPQHTTRPHQSMNFGRWYRAAWTKKMTDQLFYSSVVFPVSTDVSRRLRRLLVECTSVCTCAHADDARVACVCPSPGVSQNAGLS